MTIGQRDTMLLNIALCFYFDTLWSNLTIVERKEHLKWILDKYFLLAFYFNYQAITLGFSLSRSSDFLYMALYLISLVKANHSFLFLMISLSISRYFSRLVFSIFNQKFLFRSVLRVNVTAAVMSCSRK